MTSKKEIVRLEDTSVMSDFPSLNQLLLKDDKKGLFKHSAVTLGFPTGFLPLDYRNGYIAKVFNDKDEVVSQYTNIGIFDGTFNTIIGKTGVAKTTLAVQMAANISRYCLRKFHIPAEIYHIDAERAFDYMRAKVVTNLSINDLRTIYHIYKEDTTIEDIQERFEEIAVKKEENKKIFKIKTGILDIFGDEIELYVPTIVIIDSLPSISLRGKKGGKDESEKQEVAKIKEQAGKKDDMEANRIAKAISRFYKQMMGIIKKYNIIVFVINHINKKIEVGPMPTAPQTMYLKMDEAIPCGFAPLYYAHNIFKIVLDEKFDTSKKDKGYPFDGFRARIELLKSRSNKAGKFCHLVYDQEYGFDPYYSLYDYLKNDMDLIGGRNPYRYIKGFEDVKFDDRNFREVVKENDEVYSALFSVANVALEQVLSNTKFNSSDSPSPSDISNIYENLSASYQNDKSFDN